MGVLTAHTVASVDLEAVSDSLFCDPRVRAKLAHDYGFPVPDSATSLRHALLASFDQARVAESDSASLSARDVFRAAARALGSNNRSWATFVQREPHLRALLLDYDPAATASALKSRALLPDAIKRWLPGQTESVDARAIARWARLLADVPDYHEALLRLRDRFAGSEAQRSELPLLVAAILGSGTAGPPQKGLASWKAPGMGPILASEFLRNLRWSAFKPDRHIQRLMGRWFPDVLSACHLRAQVLSQLLGTRRADLRRFLAYSLLGIAVTPAWSSFTEVDNLVWALGAYVEEKGHESARCYRIDVA